MNITFTSRGIPTPDVKWLRNGAVLTSIKKTASLTLQTSVGKMMETSRSGNNERCDDFHLTLVVICEYCAFGIFYYDEAVS